MAMFKVTDRVTYDRQWFVEAESEDAAIERVESGEWDDLQFSETMGDDCEGYDAVAMARPDPEGTACTFFMKEKDEETLVLVESADGHSVHSNTDQSADESTFATGPCISAGWTRIDKQQAEGILGFALEGTYDASAS